MAFEDNDSFIREVNEELRSDQMKYVWKRFGPIILTVAGLIVVGTAAERGYAYYTQQQSSAAGDRFIAAMQLANENKLDDAAKAYAAIEKDGYGSYPVLARLREATLLANNGKTEDAVKDFTAISKDTSVPVAVRNAAALRAGYLLVDIGSYDQVAALCEVLSGNDNAMRHSAREVLGLSAYKAGNIKQAQSWFQMLIDDKEAPANIGRRAQMMLDVISSSGKA